MNAFPIGNPVTMRRTRAYRDGVLHKEDFPVAAVSDFLAEPDTAVWVDLCELFAELMPQRGLKPAAAIA